MIRRFVVTSVTGHEDVTALDSAGPQYLGVLVHAENAASESITFRRPLDDQPHVGDVVEFGEQLPDDAIVTQDRR